MNPNQNVTQNKSRSVRPGFTLVELLVVIALTSILLTLIFRPLTEAVNLTSRASTQIETQTNARTVISDMEKALQSAVFVYDNSQTPLNLWLPVRSKTNGVQDQTYTPSKYTMLEYVTASRQLDQVTGTETDPTTGDPIYAPDSPEGQSGYALPLAPGRSLVRVFVGLIDNKSETDTHPLIAANTSDKLQNGMPSRPYLNKFEQPARTSEDNRYTLFRASVSVYIKDPISTATPAKFVPNLGLFHTTNSTGAITDSKTDAVQLHDPNFFYDSGLAGDATSKGDKRWAVPGWKDLNGDGQVEYWENWRAVAVSMAPLEKTDLLALDRDANTNELLTYDFANPANLSTANNAVPHFRPLITFSPGSVQNDPATPSAIGNIGNEASITAPVIFTAQYSNWAIPYNVQVYRNPAVFFDPTKNTGNVDPNSDPLSLSPNLTYYQYVPRPVGASGPLYKIVEITGANSANAPDINTQMSNWTTLADVGPNPDPITGKWNLNPNFKYAFSIDARKGEINFGFSSTVVVRDRFGNAAPCYYSPIEINHGMKRPIMNAANETADAGKRFLDLRDTLQTVDGAGNPVKNFAGIRSPLDLFATTVDRVAQVQIVPGSERIYGPDQNPGPNYGYRVLYNRVSSSTDTVGKNEYRINYTDVPNATPAGDKDPRVRMGYVEFESISEGGNDVYPNLWPNLEIGTATTPAEDPAGVSGTRVYRTRGLPTQKVDRQTNLNVLADPVEITYNFQMNRANDVIKVDYLTREMINVSVEMRLYDSRSSRPQLTTLASRVKVRNLQK